MVNIYQFKVNFATIILRKAVLEYPHAANHRSGKRKYLTKKMQTQQVASNRTFLSSYRRYDYENEYDEKFGNLHGGDRTDAPASWRVSRFLL